MATTPPSAGGIRARLLPVVIIVAGLGTAVFAVGAAGHVAAALPPLAIVAAVVAVVWTPAGRTFPGRLALGVALISGPVAVMGIMFVAGGRNPVSLVFGLVFLAAGLLLLFGSPMDAAPRPATAYAPVLAAGIAALLMVAQYIASDGDAASLRFGGVFLLLSVLLAVAAGAVGPARFALGAASAAVSVALLYFVAISGQGWLPVVLAALFTAAAVASVGPVGKVRSAEPADADRRVR